MKKLSRKGFTIVELVIVVAVIAILAAVLIPTFTSVIKKANVSKDTQLVRTLNTILVTDRNAGGEHKTMQDVMDVAEDAGYNIRKINASATGNEILWDSKNDVFCYYNAAKDEVIYNETPATPGADADLWVVRSTVNEKFATYYVGKETAVTALHSFEAGEGTMLKTITYENVGASAVAKTVTIRTNSESTSLIINAPKDTINHYGAGNVVAIEAVASASYHEFGSFQKATIAQGRIVVEEAGTLPAVEIASADKAIEIKTAKDIVISASNEVTAALAGAKLENLSVAVTSNKAEIVVDALVNLEDVKVNGEQVTAADVVAITKVADLEDLNNAIAAAKPYILLTNDITVESTINITTSTTLDGNGYTLSSGKSLKKTITVNDGQSVVKTDVVIKNVTIANSYTSKEGRCLDTRGSLKSIALNNVTMISTGGTNAQIFNIGGAQADLAAVSIENCAISGTPSDYCIVAWNPVALTANNVLFSGYTSLYLKGENFGGGNTSESSLLLTNCNFDNPNGFSLEGGNTFGSIVYEDGDIDLTLDTCVFNVMQTATAKQAAILFSYRGGENVKNNKVTMKNVEINGTIEENYSTEKVSNVTRIVSGTTIKDPAGYVADTSEYFKQGTMYVIISTATDAD